MSQENLNRNSFANERPPEGTRILARAPSNIAILKYMGKSDSALNLPMNPSLSLTLNDLCTWAEVSIEASSTFSLSIGESSPKLEASSAAGLVAPVWSDASRGKAHRHVERVRNELRPVFEDLGWGWMDGAWTLRTANTFPAGAGIASSASSFAAMTLAFAAAGCASGDRFREEWRRPEVLSRITSLSRRGSGSSCRSFYGPWALWEGDAARELPAPRMPELCDLVVVVDAGTKSVSSSEAHARAMDSPIWPGRPERVARRLEKARSALESADLPALSALAWADAWEMHSLFHSLPQPFTYWSADTLEILKWAESHRAWVSDNEPPIVTLDAGPNVHLIVPRRSKDPWLEKLRATFGQFSILADDQGRGAELLENGGQKKL